MSHLLLYYQRPEPATWVFLSSFLLLSIYFVFHRFFSVRNLDIVLLILLAPGLMMVYEGRKLELASEDSIQTSSLAAVEGGKKFVAFLNAVREESLPKEGSESKLANSEVHTEKSRDLDSGTEEPSSGQNDSDLLLPGTDGKASASSLDPSQVHSNSLGASQTKLVAQTASIAAPGETTSNPLSDLADDTDRDGKAKSAYPTEGRNGWSASNLEFYGFSSLLIACALLMIRMLIDPALVRRPLLVPNLNIGGLSFIGVSLFLFLMANVITSTPGEQAERSPALGPGYVLLNMLPELPTTPEDVDPDWSTTQAQTQPWLPSIARLVAILSNLAIVIGIVGVGYWHFDNVKTGIGCTVMYLLLPYTAQLTGNLEHTVPAAFLVLALLCYRRPMIAGLLLGLAAGLVYYPLFLLPLWISFYWYRGLGRLLAGIVTALAVLVILLVFEGSSFAENVSRMFGLWLPRMEGLEGIWASENGIPADFRLPILVACILLSGSFVFWPPRKTLGTLMCGTAAIMLAVQFWHGFGGGLYMAWFLPFTLLTMFRPNLDDRVATNVVRDKQDRSSVAVT